MFAVPSLRGRALPRLAGFACLFLIGLVLVPVAFAQTQQGLQLDGATQYATFGKAYALQASSFTIEIRFKRTGAGVQTSTGTNGWANIVPLIAKGRGEAETPDTLNTNYFLGIRSDGRLAADFEEPSGPNHPIGGKVTTIANGVWYHAAVTFDASTKKYTLYLNGAVENDTTLGASIVPTATSIQHASVGTAMTSTGVAAGFFQGIVDEARIWNVARTQAQIADDFDSEVLAGSGLLGRWGFNEGAGANAGNSIANSVDGTLVGAPTWTNDSPIELSAESGLRFGGTNAYVNFGNPAGLHLPAFTVETWFRRDGAGTASTTGTGGFDGIPLVARGTGESENPAVDMNYYMGIRASDNKLMADFEEGAAGAAPSQNHPVVGTTTIVNGVWYHAAATYDGNEWRLYLNGALEAQLTVGQPAAAAGNQLASLATGLESNGTAEGFFNGALDEARVWSVARSQAEIQAAMNTKIVVPTVGLAARWGLDEDALTTVRSTAGITIDGTINGSNWSWAGVAPFNAAPPSPPAAPTGLVVTAAGATQIDLTWVDNANNEVGYEVERSTSGAGGPFALITTRPAGSTSFSNTGLAPSTNYCYRVRAINGGGASGYAGPECTTTSSTPNTALDFTGTNAYVSFGNPASLKLNNFTLEMWMRRDGAGVGTDTGSDGIIDLIPLIAKGRAENEAAAIDVNYILGIDASSHLLSADFEEGPTGIDPSQNHPVIGTTQILAGPTWHHVAATYDGTTYKLYLDGNLEGQTTIGQPPASSSDVAVALGSALNSTNVASGFFDGAVDEVRVWNVARTQAEIQSTANAQLSTPTAGLVARWALDEGTGTAVNGSAGTAVNGTVTGSGFSWTGGAPFNLTFNLPPSQPSLIVPANNATGVSTGPSLYVTAGDPDGGNVTVSWYGRPLTSSPGPDFTLIGMPDTQYYTGQLNGGTNAMLKTITNWIVANRASRNIQYVATLGDCVEHGDVGDGVTANIEWLRADTSYSFIEDPLTTGMTYGIPYGITVGNHDQSPAGSATGTTTLYNQYFGEARFAGRDYYRGHYGSNNDNWYNFFSASGMDFIVISFEYDTAPDQEVLDWADQLLTTYSNRRAIILAHFLMSTGVQTAFSAQGQATYNALRGHSNLFLMLCGHVNGEGRRTDTFNGNTVHTVMSDYQGRTNGGNGWTRIYEFSPANNVIRVRTYSPTLNQFEAEADSSSQFTLPYNMSSSGPFTLIGTGAGVASGSSITQVWPGLAPNTEYEWYATVSDGSITTQGPTWKFTTSATVGVGAETPSGIALAPIVPNPTHGRAHMSFALPRATNVRLSVLDIQGREVAVLAQGVYEAGRHSLEWNGHGAGGAVHAGLYLVRLQTPGRVDVQKMVWAR